MAQGLGSFGIFRVLLQQLATFGAGSRIIGEDSAEGDLIAGLQGEAVDQGAEAGDGVGAVLLDQAFGFVIQECGVARGRIFAVNLPEGGQSASVFSGGGKLLGVTKTRVCVRSAAHFLDMSNLRVGGVERPQPGEVRVCLAAFALGPGQAGQTCKCLSAIRLVMQDLLPGLASHLCAATEFEGAGLSHQLSGGGLIVLRSMQRNRDAQKQRYPKDRHSK